MSARKLRLIADLVRGRDLADINTMLTGLNKRGATVVDETIRQAVANAVNNMSASEQDLSLKSIMINDGPKYKRFRAGARGRTKPYVKRTAHVLVELNIKEAGAPAAVAPTAVVETAPVVAETVAAPAPTKAKRTPAKRTTKPAQAKKEEKQA
jgi:large subunit ribosomal protein L22